MICSNCKKEFEGTVCPECGADNTYPISETTDKSNQISENSKKAPDKIKNLLKKKWVWIIAAVFVIILLIGIFGNSGKSEAAKNVIAEINKLSDVSAESDLAIKRVEKLYSFLNETDQRDVSNYKKLKKARDKCDELIAEEVESQIEELNDNADLSEIEKVRNAYTALTDSQKSFVSNYERLDEVESEYYAKIISETENIINGITYVSGAITEEESQKIDEALSAYNQLDSDNKNKVSNYSKLQNAISGRDSFLISDVQKKIDNAITAKSNYSEAKEAYNKLSADAQKKITSYDKLDSLLREKNLTDGLLKQQLKIISTKYVVQDSRYKALYPDMLQVILQNNTKSDIKNAVIGFVAWDSNNLPVKIKASGFDADEPTYVRYCNYADINLVSGGKFGNNYGYSVDENCNIKYFKAIVVSYETFEGETWNNPLYNEWEELYAGKRRTID